MPSHGSQDDAARSFDAAAVEQSALEWLRTELEDPEIVGSDNFLDIGGHSLAFAKLNKYLEQTFSLNLIMKVAYSESISAAVAKAQPVRATV